MPADYQFSCALIDPNLLPNLYLSEYVKKGEHSLSFVPGSICGPLGESGSRMRLSHSYANERQLRGGAKLLLRLARAWDARR